MRISLLVLTITAFTAFSASLSIGSGGLSGWPGLPCSDVIEPALLRAGIGVEYINTDDGSILSIPLKASWGIAEDFEVGGVVSVDRKSVV